MHSKWKLWDFAKNRRGVFQPEVSLYFFQVYDQAAFHFLKDSIDRSQLNENKLHVKFGKEVTSQWFDDEFRTLSLFGNSDSYLIHFAEEIPVEVLDAFLEPEKLNLTGRSILFNFSKNTPWLKKLEKKESTALELIRIQAPAFWEEQELLSFLMDENQYYLGHAERKFFCENIPFSISDYQNVLSQLKLNFPKANELTIQAIQELIGQEKFDQFKLAEFFGNKKLKKFYQHLIKLVENGQDYTSFLYFMFSHMQKVYDRGYGKAKPRLTKYDKQILFQQELWQAEDTARALSYLNELLQLSKEKKAFFLSRIRRDYLKTLNF